MEAVLQMMNYANIGRRLFGWLIDLIITFPVSWIIHKSDIGRDVVLSQLLFMLLEGSYFVVFWLVKGASPGMMLMRIKMTTDEGPLTIWRAIIRYVGLYVSILFLGLGGLWMLWGKRRQTWQDKMARTFVVKIT